jgi:hypothetical protein
LKGEETIAAQERLAAETVEAAAIVKVRVNNAK